MTHFVRITARASVRLDRIDAVVADVLSEQVSVIIGGRPVLTEWSSIDQALEALDALRATGEGAEPKPSAGTRARKAS